MSQVADASPVTEVSLVGFTDFNNQVRKKQIEVGNFNAYLQELKDRKILTGNLDGREMEALRSTYNELTGNSS